MNNSHTLTSEEQRFYKIINASLDQPTIYEDLQFSKDFVEENSLILPAVVSKMKKRDIVEKRLVNAKSDFTKKLKKFLFTHCSQEPTILNLAKEA